MVRYPHEVKGKYATLKESCLCAGTLLEFKRVGGRRADLFCADGRDILEIET